MRGRKGKGGKERRKEGMAGERGEEERGEVRRDEGRSGKRESKKGSNREKEEVGEERENRKYLPSLPREKNVGRAQVLGCFLESLAPSIQSDE